MGEGGWRKERKRRTGIWRWVWYWEMCLIDRPRWRRRVVCGSLSYLALDHFVEI